MNQKPSNPDPSQSGWQDRLLSVADDQPNARQKDKTRRFPVEIPSYWHPLVMEAAKRRNISITGYMRRAIMAFVVRDLGLNWEKVMDDEPSTMEYTDPFRAQHDLRGTGRGEWQITGTK